MTAWKRVRLLRTVANETNLIDFLILQWGTACMLSILFRNYTLRVYLSIDGSSGLGTCSCSRSRLLGYVQATHTAHSGSTWSRSWTVHTEYPWTTSNQSQGDRSSLHYSRSRHCRWLDTQKSSVCSIAQEWKHRQTVDITACWSWESARRTEQPSEAHGRTSS